jgi:ProP effector
MAPRFADGTVSAEHAVTAKELEKRRATYRARKEAERKADEEAAHKRYTNAWAIIDTLTKLYPLTFFIKGHKRRPLGLDTIKELIETGMPEHAVTNALHFYMGSYGYLKSVKEGAERINLSGEPVSSVTADEAADAAAGAIACRVRMNRRREKQKAEAAQAPAIIEAAPLQEVQPTTTEAAQPKRRLLGLADLKATAMARRMENAI